VIDVEGRLRFSFDENWSATKWDDHPAYRDGLAKFEATQAVDIVATQFRDRLWLIEVKDPRGHRISFKGKLAALDDIVRDKVRDTIAGMTWIEGRMVTDVDHYRTVLFTSDDKPTVVLWLEGAEHAYATAFKDKIERRLRWLRPRVRVTNRTLLNQAPIDGLTVESLPGAGQS
jgi:hypothetical protein